MAKAMFGSLNRAKSNIKNIYNNVSTALMHNFKLVRRTMLVAPLALLVVVVTIFGLTVNTSYAYAVSYDGETIGYVSSQEVYTEAMETITQNTDNTAVKNLSTVLVEEKVAAGEHMLDAEDLSRAIVDSVDEIQENFGLFKDGELYATCYTEKQIESALHKYLSENNDGLSDAKLSGKYEIKKGIYSTETLINSEMLYNQLCNDKPELSGYRVETRTEKIDFDTVVSQSDDYSKGETVILQEGEYGSKQITEKVYYNGDTPVLREEISSETVKEAVSKKVVEGTGSLSGGAKMTFPLSESSGYYVSSPYGDPRYGYYHRGVDIIAPYGTSIHAVAGGTVVEAGYSNGGWGYTVVIDHGNGIKSRYAHCSYVNVSVGAQVNRGDCIAAVGSTGYSECNHLHLEVTVNGAHTNPMNYFN